MENFKPTSLADLLPDEEERHGYTWRKVWREHTLEFVGYDDDDTEIGTAIILRSDGSPEAHARAAEIYWVEDRVNAIYPDGLTLDRLQEVVMREYEMRI